jgi:hypothetical protein
MLTFHRTKGGGDDFNVINEGQRVGRIYRTTGIGTERWLWEINVELVSPGGQRNGVADSRALAMAAFKQGWIRRR